MIFLITWTAENKPCCRIFENGEWKRIIRLRLKLTGSHVHHALAAGPNRKFLNMNYVLSLTNKVLTLPLKILLSQQLRLCSTFVQYSLFICYYFVSTINSFRYALPSFLWIKLSLLFRQPHFPDHLYPDLVQLMSFHPFHFHLSY